MTETDRVQRIGGALGWGVAARLARMVLSVIGSILVVRGLGPYDYGILAVVRTLLAYIVIVAGAGLAQGILRYLPAWRVSGNPAAMKRTILASFAVQAVLWALVVLGAMALRSLVAGLSTEQVAGFLILGVALLFPEMVSHTATQISNAHYDSRRVGVAVFVSALLYVGLVVWFLDRGMGVAGVLIAAAVSNALVAFILILRTPKYLEEAGRQPRDPSVPSPGLRSVMAYSFPFLWIGLLNLITWRQSEVLFLGHFHGPDVAGFFDLAYRLPQLLLEFVPGAIWPLVMAGFAEVYTRDRLALQRTTSAYYKLLFLLVAPLSVGGVLVGDLAVDLLYGPEYAVAGGLCQAFFFIFSLSFISTPLSMVLYVIERPWIGFAIGVVNATVNLGLDWLLIPRYGLWGAVVPVTLVIVASPFIYQWVLRRMGVAIALPWAFLGRIYGASAIMLLLWPLRGMAAGPLGLGALVLAGAALFFVFVRVFRVLGRDEIQLIDRVNPPGWHKIAPVLTGSGRGS